MVDERFVIHVGAYIESSTRSEIVYAYSTGKPVRYLTAEDSARRVKCFLI